MQALRIFLAPLAIIYGFIIFMRNRCYDWGLFSSESYNFPVIVLGNLSVGGTGKTPMTDYLIALCKNKKRVAVLSRGYKRKSEGYLLADVNSTPDQIGDEPYLLLNHHPEISLAVCADRQLGISNLLADRKPELIILDDAFQHRKIMGGLNILLTTYQRPFVKDHLLPWGDLRDNKFEKRRADIIVVTKCPKNMNAREQENLRKEINPQKEQGVFFSTLDHGQPAPLIDSDLTFKSFTQAIVVSGIAAPEEFVSHCQSIIKVLKHYRYKDHHDFSEQDLKNICQSIEANGKRQTAVLCTEKDAVKIRRYMRNNAFLPAHFFYIPLYIKFDNHQANFEKLILDFAD